MRCQWHPSLLGNLETESAQAKRNFLPTKWLSSYLSRIDRMLLAPVQWNSQSLELATELMKNWPRCFDWLWSRHLHGIQSIALVSKSQIRCFGGQSTMHWSHSSIYLSNLCTATWTSQNVLHSIALLLKDRLRCFACLSMQNGFRWNGFPSNWCPPVATIHWGALNSFAAQEFGLNHQQELCLGWKITN